MIASLSGRDATGIYSLGYLVGESLLALPSSVVYLTSYAVIMRLWDAGDEGAALALSRRLCPCIINDYDRSRGAGRCCRHPYL